MQEFITIAVFNFAHEITILKTILDREEIPYLFQNENLVSIDPLASIAYGGIKLKVHPNDQERVQQIIDDLNRPKLNIV
ncbi:DUF2007 domain-containing protein [Flavobacterium sp. CYK-55]|uniref:DUF2007 domain-containing protein n=1 Tax=Flavobacterium sp. CYK-55 TaxID=2835529 RepID=UPI001BCAA2DE|nr:DUF2007 domain-containing protein [Flavobacterium sp. CYK-55]MBS7786159.1 DUF2007 domain-containing protein [Flavobacterium sp. CYK-55]